MLKAILTGNPSAQRRAIAKAITLLESTRADHRAQADELLTALLPYTGKSLRLGISGVPGVGKSTFIEALGLYLIGQGHRVAVLAVDPSSTVSGGSILGTKPAWSTCRCTKMPTSAPARQQRHTGRCGREDPRGHAGVRGGGL
jgi:LAO/AO transport system kinase